MKRNFFLFLVLFAAIDFNACGLIVIKNSVSSAHFLNRPGFHWLADSSTHFLFYYEPATWAARHIDSVKADAERSWLHCLELLGEPSPSFRICYFVVESRKRMGSLVSKEMNSVAFFNPAIVCAFASDSNNALGPHEIFHILSTYYLGTTSQWISEGMAVYSEDSWWKMDLHSLNHYFQTKGLLIPTNDLVARFNSFDDMIAYPESGSFLKFLCQRFGKDGVKFLWQKGPDAFFSSEHTSMAAVEQEWLQSISRTEVDAIQYPL